MSFWNNLKNVILFVQISIGKESNFDKAQTETVDNQGIGYDYHSVMHYSGNAFSRNGRPTIEPKVIKREFHHLHDVCLVMGYTEVSFVFVNGNNLIVLIRKKIEC